MRGRGAGLESGGGSRGASLGGLGIRAMFQPFCSKSIRTGRAAGAVLRCKCGPINSSTTLRRHRPLVFAEFPGK